MSAPGEVLAAVERGWSVIPVKADKRPFGPWKASQERPATVEEVNAQAARSPAAWAVVTGAVSGIVALDFDDEAGMAQLAEFGFEPNVITGSGGVHVYFEAPGHRVPTLNSKSAKAFGELLPGVDVKGDGGYAIFAGRNGEGPYELRSAEALPWAAWPKAVEEALQSPPPSATRSLRVGVERTSEVLVAELVQDALRRVDGGEGRNNAGFELARALRDAGLAQAAALQAGAAFIAAVPPTNQHDRDEPYTQGVWGATVRSAYSRPARVTPSITVNTKGEPVLPAVPSVDDAAGQCAWLTAVFALDLAHPVIGGARHGLAGPDGHVVLLRADAQAIRFEPVRVVNNPARLVEALNGWALPSDGAVPGFKAQHCRQIAQVLRMICGRSEALTAREEAEGAVVTFLNMAQAREGLTTYGSTRDRFLVAEALAEYGERVVIDANTGEYVIRVSDLATVARLHFGCSLQRGWLEARMEALGWSRIELQGFAEAGRDGRRGPHLRVTVYRGLLPEASAGSVVNT